MSKTYIDVTDPPYNATGDEVTDHVAIIAALNNSETQIYDHPEDANICYFIDVQNNDATDFRALSRSVLTKCLELVGFGEIRRLKLMPTEGLAKYMARIILVAQKPERPSVRPYALQHIAEQTFS
jgi:hypothetical protein